jgi:alkylation response protein AidB-like acyl-CoA dehydrogenase
MAEAGLFRMLVPRSLGGFEVHPRDFVDVLATLGRGDGAAAWCVMTGSTTSLVGAYLPVETAASLWKEDPTVIMAGVFAPMGRARPVEGGYRLSGRWPFASGSENASWRLGGALVMDESGPRKLESGQPEIRSFFFRADESTIHDTWHTAGLCGTGSHDMEVEDIFVPEERSCSVMGDAPRHEGALYRFPIFGLLAAGVAAVGLGIARAAMSDLCELAQTKKSFGGRRGMADQDLVQVEVGRAEGELRAGQSLLRQTCDEVWEAATKGELSLADRASLRLAATQATRAAVRSVDAMYQTGGGTALYRKSPLQRHLRDIHTVTQHIMVAPATMKTVGRVLLGVETDVSQL